MSDTIEGTVRRSDETVLAFQVHGRRAAPALLLLPGQANSHHWWDGLRDRFAPDFRTVTFDYRGTGSTRARESLDAGWSTSMFAADAVAILDELGCGRAHVYGTSMGGRVAQMLAIEHGHRLDRLVLACTSPGGRRARERSKAVLESLAQRDSGARRQALLDLMYTPAWPPSARKASNLLGDPGMSTMATRLHLRVSARHDACELLSSITAPVLVLHGGDDLMAPVQNAHLLAEQIPSAVLEILEGARHGFFDEFAETVTARVKAFLVGPPR